MRLIRTITLHKFPTHVKLSDKRKAKYDIAGNITNPRAVGTPRYLKINSQGLWNGNMSPLIRQKIAKNLHLYINEQIRKELPFDSSIYPIIIRGKVYTPKNLGSYKMVKGELKSGKDLEQGGWDILNFGFIWVKTFEDCIKADDPWSRRKALIIDDDVDHVEASGEMRRVWIDNFEDRKIEFEIYSLSDESITTTTNIP